MRVRVHKNRTLDRTKRPCRCWIVLSAPRYKPLGACESVLLRDVEFLMNEANSAGWAVGLLTWMDNYKAAGREQELCRRALQTEQSADRATAPDAGWEGFRFEKHRGFFLPSGEPLLRADWLLLDPWSDQVHGPA